MKNISIRNGYSSDIADIHRLVGELAKFENASHQFICSQQEYLQLFEEEHWFSVIAENEHSIIGICIYYFGFSTWKGKFLYLEDFVVSKNYRRKGIGQLLFDRLIQTAKKENCALMRWQVLDWNELAINFYKKYDVEFDDEWVNCQMSFHTDHDS
jgi:GNAT superfamily N-acetyltransferase